MKGRAWPTTWKLRFNLSPEAFPEAREIRAFLRAQSDLERARLAKQRRAQFPLPLPVAGTVYVYAILGGAQ